MTKICNIFPAYHSITCCGRTSSDAMVCWPLEKIIKIGKENFLADFSQSCSNKTALEEAMTFFKTIMYAGKEKESITQTRCRMFMKRNIESNTNLIPDKGSIMEHLKRTNL